MGISFRLSSKLVQLILPFLSFCWFSTSASIMKYWNVLFLLGICLLVFATCGVEGDQLESGTAAQRCELLSGIPDEAHCQQQCGWKLAKMVFYKPGQTGLINNCKCCTA